MTDTTPAPIGEDTLREALWICVEHNALHFGETHNTVVQGRAALAGAAQPPITYASPSPILGVAPSGPGTSAAHAAAPKAAPASQDAEDAARYRWLRELRSHANPPIHGSVWVVKYHQQPGTIPELRSAGFGEVLDATIDADRAKLGSLGDPHNGAGCYDADSDFTYE